VADVENQASGAGRLPAGSVVGIVGGGQLARMLCEAATPLGLTTVVLCERPDDAAASVAGVVLLGRADDPEALAELAAACEVVTFDHEQVDLDALAALVAGGATIFPGPATLEVAVDKAAMRRTLARAGLPVPRFCVVDDSNEARTMVEDLVDEVGLPLVLKPARGGYDGRGVFIEATAAAALTRCEALLEFGPVLCEAWVPLREELAVIVARRPGGDQVTYPPVRTTQIDGMCREVLVPSGIDPGVSAAASALASEVARVLGAVGLLAVELFSDGESLSICEVAARPHNSGHWSIEGATTSQFENHLRAVLDLPLGSTEPTAAAVAMVNILGSEAGPDPRTLLAQALEVNGAHLHLYAKAAVPGRKLGHVTVTGPDLDAARAAAWEAAIALGTPRPASMER